MIGDCGNLMGFFVDWAFDCFWFMESIWESDGGGLVDARIG